MLNSPVLVGRRLSKHPPVTQTLIRTRNLDYPPYPTPAATISARSIFRLCNFSLVSCNIFFLIAISLSILSRLFSAIDDKFQSGIFTIVPIYFICHNVSFILRKYLSGGLFLLANLFRTRHNCKIVQDILIERNQSQKFPQQSVPDGIFGSSIWKNPQEKTRSRMRTTLKLNRMATVKVSVPCTFCTTIAREIHVNKNTITDSGVSSCVCRVHRNSISAHRLM